MVVLIETHANLITAKVKKNIQASLLTRSNGGTRNIRL